MGQRVIAVSIPPCMPCTRWGLPPHAITGTETALIIADFSFLVRLYVGQTWFLWHFPLPRITAGPVAVSDHLALWCSDFPPPARAGGNYYGLKDSLARNL